jgi:hypothetical protein
MDIRLKFNWNSIEIFYFFQKHNLLLSWHQQTRSFGPSRYQHSFWLNSRIPDHFSEIMWSNPTMRLKTFENCIPLHEKIFDSVAYSLMNMRQLHILFNEAKTWHGIVCWFLCIYLFLPVFAWCDHKIVLQIKKNQ